MPFRRSWALILASGFAATCVKADAFVRSERNCLNLVWSHQRSPSKVLDRKYDGSGDNAFSCATLTSATAFEKTLRRIRIAALRGNRLQLLALSRFPLTYVDLAGRRSSLSISEAAHKIGQVFPSKLMERLKKINLRQMEVVSNKGAFFDHGTLWLSPSEVGGNPAIITIDLRAFEEARHSLSTPRPNR